jgi:hypothetical protein
MNARLGLVVEGAFEATHVEVDQHERILTGDEGVPHMLLWVSIGPKVFADAQTHVEM